MIFGYQNHKLSVWPLLYFLSMADVWNFVIHSYDPKLKSLFSFFKILIRCWDTRVQIYSTSARKIFGVAKKRRVPEEKCSCRSIKKTNMFKAKTVIEKMGTRYSDRCPDHLSRKFLTTASTFPYSSKNSSAEHIYAFLYILLCAWVWVRQCVCVCVWESESMGEYLCLCEWVSERVSKYLCLCEWVREWVSVFCEWVRVLVGICVCVSEWENEWACLCV